jgi:hypothetical protein
LVARWVRSKAEKPWDSAFDTSEPEEPPPPPPKPKGEPHRRELERLRETIPDFSIILFEDFVHAFWSELAIAASQNKLDHLMPWLGPGTADNLPLVDGEVSTPIVGAITYRGVAFSADRVTVRLTIEGMYSANGGSQWVRDRWRLTRSRHGSARPPALATVFRCPSCGAAPETGSTGRCPYCAQIVNTGEFDWVLIAAQRDACEVRPPQLTGDVEEQGTELPTIRDPDVDQELAQLGLDQGAFFGRLTLAFQEIQAGWGALDLARIRPWVTDRQLDSFRFWLDAYRASGLRNISNNRINGTELVRVTRDRWYDAVTVRVFASGNDYTIDGRDRVVSGSREREREFTEYWTMIRGRSATGTIRTDKACPNCGAPLAINMAGSCTHCQAHVVSGEFDWVLSRIEQDDSYTG